MIKWLNNRENAKYLFCLRILYGVAVGAVMCAYYMLCRYFDFGQPCFALAGAAIPIVMSGGIYLSGFMNTSAVLTERLNGKSTEDSGRAAASGKPDSGAEPGHAGTHAVIAAMTFYLLYAGGLSAVRKDRQIALLAIGYMISRTLHGMAFVWFPGAEEEKGKRGEGNLSPAIRKMLRMILSVILALCFCTCVVIEPIMGMLEALLCMWVWTYYYYMSKKLFGGVTKESAEYFLTLCELALVLFVGMFGRALL